MRQPLHLALVILIASFLATPLPAANVHPKDLLAGPVPIEKLKGILLPREKYHPYPTAAEREPWGKLSDSVRKVLVERGEEALKSDWPATPATLMLEYVRNGDRNNYQRASFGRRTKLRDLVLAECIENKGRFVDEIVNGVWLICEESFWGVPAHLSAQKAGSGLPDVSDPTVDLFAAETSGLLSWTDYLVGPKLDKVSPLVRQRIWLEIDRRILAVNLRNTGAWMGLDGRGHSLNNWTPWINSNWLTTVLLMERDEDRRVQSVHKIMRSLDQFLNAYPDDGGCDEGPGYWGRAGASLFDCLELLNTATAGQIEVYKIPLVQEMGKYICRAHVAGDYFVNFADATGRQHIPADLVFRYGQRINDPTMIAFGAHEAADLSDEDAVHSSMLRMLPALFNLSTLRAAKGQEPLLRDAWLPDTQVMFARVKAGSTDGLYIAAQGGHNAESHNHNDVGNFIAFADGKPVLIDIGAPTYTSKTFSSKRYEIWAMQSAWHNCPTINGIMQSPGRQFAAQNVAYRSNDEIAEMSMDIAAAYPADANIKQWNRTLRLNRGKEQSIEVIDNYSLTQPAKDIAFSFITPCFVKILEPGKLALSETPDGPRRAILEYDPTKLKAVPEETEVRDERLQGVWGKRVCRILLRQENPPAEGDYRARITQ